MTATPRFELDPAPDPGRDLPPGPLTIGLVVAGGFLIGGPFGLLVAVRALAVGRRHPEWRGDPLARLAGAAPLGAGLGAATHVTGAFAFAAVGKAIEMLLRPKRAG